MSRSYPRYNVSEKLISVVAEPERFESIILDAPDSLAGYEVGLVFGSTLANGGLSDEVIANDAAMRRSSRNPTPKLAKRIIDPLLTRVADLTGVNGFTEEIGPEAHSQLQGMAVEVCVEQGYETFAGLVVSFSGRDQVAHLFYAKPLEGVALNVREAALRVKLQGLLDPDVLARDHPEISMMSVNANLNPNEAQRKITAMTFGALMLPRALGESAIPIGS